MMRMILCIASVLASCVVARSDDSSTTEHVDYLKQVKPVLLERCYACHGALKQEGGLRLDTVALAMQGGDSGAAVVAADRTKSQLWQRITSTDPATRMPQEGEPLKPEQIEAIGRWIDQNAIAPADEKPEEDPRDHWSFQPVKRPEVPADSINWSRNPIDAFIAAGYRAHGLAPQQPADRGILIRRLFMDLVGMPASDVELLKIEADYERAPTSDEWYTKLVDRLLDDRRYGERWGRHWMDIWRYSDWWGLGDQLRNSQYHMWHYRDWIIESLNASTPYDEMVRQMLAADELYPDDPTRLRATGFLARNWFLFNRNPWMEETVEHVSKAFLGLTMNCAKCHDHKYDPIDHVDFYRMRAFFEPYHVRLDMVPGEVDLNRNGVPRAFDALLDAPTYRYERGEESRPDKSKVIAPGVPAMLAFKELEVDPVQLPPAAWQPERQPWVVENLAKAAKDKQAAAVAEFHAAEQKLASTQAKREAFLAERHSESETNASESTTGEKTAGEGQAGEDDKDQPLVDERFESLDDSRWLTLGGEWVHEKGVLRQNRDGAERAALRFKSSVPQDFEATLRYTLRGGSQWRSVGIEFDARGGQPNEALQADSQMIYLSGYAGGSKIQAAHSRANQWDYPGDGQRPFAVELNRVYTLRIVVRNDLINAYVDDQLALAYRMPQARQSGALQFITFDALADFHSVQIKKLADTVKLVQPGNKASGEPATLEEWQAAVADAQAVLAVSEARVALATAEAKSLEACTAAWRAVWSRTDAASQETLIDSPDAVLRNDAIRSEREVAMAKARVDVASAELKLLRAAADQRPTVETECKAARDVLAKAEEAVKQPIGAEDRFTRLSGARWTPTRFLNSSADDPTVEFVPQSTGRRRALADWITDRRNPLTARVAVNHIWTRHMGTPLVATVFDFGRKGSKPTNPELLDWLAAELMENGWSMKHLHRLIVNSSVYRLSSSSSGMDSNVAVDPDNLFWWRRNPIRLESQAVRDSILQLAGTLDLTTGGPPVPIPNQMDSKRRSLYFFHSNNDRNLFLTLFDEALVKECYRRDQSIVPQQALALVNSRLVFEAAEMIESELSKSTHDKIVDGKDMDSEFIRLAFRKILSVQATEREIEVSRAALERWMSMDNQSESQARALLIWSLLNHNDFVTLR